MNSSSNRHPSRGTRAGGYISLTDKSRKWLLLSFFVCLLGQSLSAQIRPVDWVDPHIDAANSRWFFFSSACRPFGMVNLSPDNLIGGTWGTGYRYHVDTIRGFSHVHAWQLSGVSVMPTTKNWSPSEHPDEYSQTFSHDDEIVKAGYHKVKLDDGIQVELTSTTRVGFHRYTYPVGENPLVIFNLTGPLGPSVMTKGQVAKTASDEIAGYTVNGATRRRPKEAMVYFVAKFDRDIGNFEAWQGDQYLEEGEAAIGPKCGVRLEFEPARRKDPFVRMKVGISYVSIEQARRNLEAELDHWDFDQVVEESQNTWNDYLGRIEVQGGTKDQTRRFYTDLWHALQGRRIISDADGKYCDMTGAEKRIGQIPLDAFGQPRFNHYNSDSYWGAQWTLNTLWHLVYPEITEEFCQSMLMMYRDGGLIPRGPSGGNYTYVMTGASSTPFFVSAYQKGILGNIDWEEAYTALRKNHMPGGIMTKAGYEHDTELGGGLEYYIERGYVPYPLPKRPNSGYHEDGGGQTLENAYQDWTMAQLALAMGKTGDYKVFMTRAQNYRNLYDPSVGWMRPKTLENKWFAPYDPLKYDDGWVETTAAASTWFVPHDLKGLAQLMGGEEALIKKLNQSFELASEHDFVNPSKDERDKYLNYGNQPSMQTAHIFNYVGAPWLTQYWTREVIDRTYSGADPDHGYFGDEDQGLMGALSVLLKTGLFSMKGGCSTDPYYEFSGPLFDQVRFHLNPAYYPGGSFAIEANNLNQENRYIQSATWREQAWDQAFVMHQDLIQGGILKFEMGSSPNRSWGQKPLPTYDSQPLPEDSVFLFSYFTGNGEDGLHLAASEDGLNWDALQDGQSFLAPLRGTDSLMRDPCITRGPDGTFHMVWTTSWNANNIGHASSRDLIHWTKKQQIPVMAHEPTVRNSWAPEILYDASSGYYMIYWASTIPGRFEQSTSSSEDDYNHRMYYTLTRDFEYFTPTTLLYDHGFNVIDGTIVSFGERYAMFLKDETLKPTPEKNIKIAWADRPTGPWRSASEPITGDYWAEGPTVVKQNGEYLLYFDKYRKHAFGLLSSPDLENWTDRSAELKMPEGIRHGTAFKVERSLVAKIKAYPLQSK